MLLLTVTSRGAPTRQSRAGAKPAPAPLSQPDAATQERLTAAYGRLPLSFEANQGQADSRVQFLSRGKGYNLFLTSTEAVLRLGKADCELPNKEQLTASVNSLHQTPFSAVQFPESTRHIPYSAFRTPHSNLRAPQSVVVRMKLVGAKPQPKVAGLEDLSGKANYFLGNDPKRWRTNVPTYGKVKYHDVYPGIDLVYYGRQQQLEYDFVLAPGADPRRLRMTFEGADKLDIDAEGNLVLHTAGSELVQRPPNIYQEIEGTRHTISGRYVLLDGESSALTAEHSPGTPQQVGFEVDRYDTDQALVIDPVLVYSTYLGGSGDDVGSDIVVDLAGNAYVTGQTFSTDFPTQNPLQPANGSDFEAFVTKLNAAGTALIYSTYLGGSGDDHGGGIAVDASGNAYVTGNTRSLDFPTQNPLQPVFGGGFYGDAFVTKLNAAGSALVYSTYLGGSDNEFLPIIAVEPSGNAYVTGITQSADFPTKNPLQPARKGTDTAFVTKLNATGSALVYSTYLGGSIAEFGLGIAADLAGNAYVTGITYSPDFPTKNPLQPTLAGGICFGTPCPDAFVTKLNAAGSALVYSTFLGGSGEERSGGEVNSGIAVDSTGNAYVTGVTNSADFPTKNPLQPVSGGDFDAFVTKLNAAGSALVYSTYLGGSGFDFGNGIAVDSAGGTYLTGWTFSTDFPTQNPLQPVIGTGDCDVRVCYDAFVAKIATGSVTLQVAIDIKPGGSPNSINPGSNGNIPVAVLTTDSFDASSVDPSTVRFGLTGEEAAPLRSSLEDVDGDGDLDLVLHFATQQTGILCGGSSARLTGQTFDGQQIEGSDSVKTVGCD
jgi:hypothetical protein